MASLPWQLLASSLPGMARLDLLLPWQPSTLASRNCKAGREGKAKQCLSVLLSVLAGGTSEGQFEGSNSSILPFSRTVRGLGSARWERKDGAQRDRLSTVCARGLERKQPKNMGLELMKSSQASQMLSLRAASNCPCLCCVSSRGWFLQNHW